MTKESDELERLLSECEVHLRSVHEKVWAGKIRSVREQIANAPGSAGLAGDILGWYGGMGSFNDLVLSRYNGHLVTQDDENDANIKLKKLRLEIHKTAQSLYRSGYRDNKVSEA